LKKFLEKTLEEDINHLKRKPKEVKSKYPNIIVLINVLIEINLEINYIKKELNHIKLIKFKEMKAKNSNK